MTDNENILTDEQIIRAVKHCISIQSTCGSCPLFNLTNCDKILMKSFNDFINRQKAEIERLQSMVDAELDTIHDLGDDYERVLEEENELVKTAKSEAIKEFAERLKEYTYDIVLYGEIVTVSQIDSLVKEMTE